MEALPAHFVAAGRAPLTMSHRDVGPHRENSMTGPDDAFMPFRFEFPSNGEDTTWNF